MKKQTCVERYEDLFEFACLIFDSEKRAHTWMNRRLKSLDYSSPKEALRSNRGIKLLDKLTDKMEMDNTSLVNFSDL